MPVWGITDKTAGSCGGDAGALEIDHVGPAKIRSDCLFLAFTTFEHLGYSQITK